MSKPSWPRVLRHLCAALAGEDSERALTDALAILSDVGIVPQPPGPGAPWLTVERAGRSLSLAKANDPPDAEIRDIIANLLRVALGRAGDEEQHRKVRERVEMLSAASFEGILVHVDGVVIDANQRLAEMLGCEPAEVLGPDTLRRCVAPEDLPGVLSRMQSRYEGAYAITGVRKDGSRFRAELQSKQGHLGARPVRVVAVRDVTERERTNALLRESEVRLRDLADVAFDFIVVSRNGVMVDVGGAIKEKLGLDPESLKGRPVLDIVAPASHALVTQMVQKQWTGAYEAEIVGGGGELVPVEVVGVTSTLGGEPVRVAGLRDLRQRRQLERERATLEQRVERSQRLESLGVLAGGIAHDFNNLLVGVLGNAEILLGHLSDPAQRQTAQAILSAGERAAALTAQMLAYAGHRDLGRREPVDLGALCHELRELLDAALSKKARIEFSIEPGSVVLGDRATLSQVLMNLLTNASDALEDNPGVINVKTSRIREPGPRFEHALGVPVGPGDWVLTEVRDTGVGMAPSTIGRALEPFFSTKDKGHGLGLAACLGIVSAHGGAILIESELGRGSCFSVLLPATMQAHATAPQPSRPAREATRRVLIVDDEPLVRSMMGRLLRLEGFTVEEASDGRSGLAALERGPVDVLVMDMTMPDLDGAEVVRLIRASGSTVPIVLSSGYMDADAGRALDRSMIQGFLPKPFSRGELLDIIERALAGR